MAAAIDVASGVLRARRARRGLALAVVCTWLASPAAHAAIQDAEDPTEIADDSPFAVGATLRGADLELDARQVLTADAGLQWIPWRFRLRNRSADARRVTLTVMDQSDEAGARGRVVWELDLGPAEELRRIIPIYCSRSMQGTVGISVEEAGETVLSSGSGPGFQSWIRRKDDSAELEVGVLIVQSNKVIGDMRAFRGAFRQALETAGGRQETIQCHFEDAVPRELPVHPEAYLGVDRLVLAGVEPADVSEAQAIALREAVRSGLRVWIVPGRGGEGNGWIVPAHELAPVPEVMNIDGASKTIFLDRDRAGAVVSSYPGRLDVPAIVGYAEGFGEWRRQTAAGELFFREDLERPWVQWFQYPLRVAAAARYRNPTNLQMPAEKELVRMWTRGVRLEYVFAFMVLYVLVVGPGLFIVLRRRGRLIWLLWLQPVVVAVFLCASFLMAYVHFGMAARAEQIVFLYQNGSDDWAYANVILHRYEARGGRLSFATGNGVVPLPLSAGASASRDWRLSSAEGREEIRLVDVFFPHWSTGQFTSHGAVRLPGCLRVEVRDSQSRVENGFPFPVQSLRLFRGSSISRGDDGKMPLDPGESMSFGQFDAASGKQAPADPFDRILQTVAAHAFERNRGKTVAVAELLASDIPGGIPCGFSGTLTSSRVFLVATSME